MSNLGTLEVPSADDVRLGVPVDAGFGNCRVPAGSKVQDGYDYDSNDSVTGSYEPRNPKPATPVFDMPWVGTGVAGETLIKINNGADYQAGDQFVAFRVSNDKAVGGGYCIDGNFTVRGVSDGEYLYVKALRDGKYWSIAGGPAQAAVNDASVYPDPKAVIGNGAHTQPTFGPTGTENTPSAKDPADTVVKLLETFGYDGAEVGAYAGGGTVAPAAPVITAFTVANGTITISVTGDAGATNELWYRAPGGAWTLGGSIVGDGDITKTGLVNGMVYEVCARSYK